MLIVDTDVGSDPDDAVALVVAAKAAPDLALVLTNDENDGERARLARHLLDLAGRPEVPVVAGTRLPGTPAMVIAAPTTVGSQPGGVAAAVAGVVASVAAETVRWLGIGAMTNLSTVLSQRPVWASRLRIVQMGGALNYRDPSRAEHNMRRDPAALLVALRQAQVLGVPPLSFVMSEHTFRPEIGIGATSPFYRHWSRAGATGWERLLVEHHDAFFARCHPQSLEHDPLTLSALLDEPFVRFVEARIAVDELGRMCIDEHGWPVRLSAEVEYDGFLAWLDARVGPVS